MTASAGLGWRTRDVLCLLCVWYWDSTGELIGTFERHLLLASLCGEIHCARGLQDNSLTRKPSIKPLRYNFVYYFISCVAAGRWPLPLHVQRPHRVLRYLIIFVVYAYLFLGGLQDQSDPVRAWCLLRALLPQTANLPFHFLPLLGHCTPATRCKGTGLIRLDESESGGGQ